MYTDDLEAAPFPWQDSNTETTCHDVSLTVAGTEWVYQQYSGRPCTVINRKDLDVTFLPRASDAEPNAPPAKLVLELPSASLEEQIPEDAGLRVLQGGTIPWKKIGDYLIKQLDRVENHGTITLRDEVTELLELRVPREDYRILHGAPPAIVEHDLMLLRIYCVPRKGYAVARMEYCTPDGTMSKRFDSVGLTAVSDEIWFPKEFYVIRHLPKASSKYYIDQYLVKEVSGINQDHLSSFDVLVPLGTEVYDNRGESTSTHVSVKEDQLKGIEASLHAKAKQDGLNNVSQTRRVLVIVNGIVFVVILLFMLFRWFRVPEKRV